MADLNNELDLNAPVAPTLTLDSAPAAPTLTLDPAADEKSSRKARRQLPCRWRIPPSPLRSRRWSTILPKKST